MNKKSANRQLHRRSQHRLKPVYAAVLLAFAIQAAEANPIGGTVTNGSAGFATSGNTLTVTNTPGTIINWQGFSIGSNEITNFAQQSASSTVLNRVVGNDPSSILGTLRSNGRVFLVNPNGILFGAGAVVDVAGLVASTLNLGDADFKAGKYHFTEVPGAGNISNAGNIAAQDNGQIYLIAPNVDNTGVITAPNGEILLAAGHSVDLVNTNDPNLRVNITAPAGDATNVGKLIASSGSLGLFGTVVRNGGVVSADSATMQGGKIVFKASQRVEAGGTISAQGTGGGTINLLADMQGGTVNVSGTLDASAPVSGNGGFIETSAAKVQVSDRAHIATPAANGNTGTWLIDPQDFMIAATGGDMTGATLATQLNTTNVTIQDSSGATAGNGDIIVNDTVTKSGPATTTLTLQASNNILVTAGSSITSTAGKLNVTLNADSDAFYGGGIYLDTGSVINSNGGDILMGGGANAAGYAVGNGSSTSNIAFNSGIYVLGNITAGSGNITMRGEGAYNNFADGITFAGGTLSSNGMVTIDGLAHGYSTGITTPNLFAAGVDFAGMGTLLTTQTGTVNVTGTNTAPNQDPVYYRADGIMVETGAVVETTGTGSLTFNGTAQSYNTSWGIGLFGGTIQSTAAGGGAITLNGSNISGLADSGIVIYNSNVLSNGGNISMTGQGLGAAVAIDGTSVVGGVSSGNVQLTGLDAGQVLVNSAASLTVGGTLGITSLGDININSVITQTRATSGTTTLKAANNINFGSTGGITSTGGALNVVLRSDSDASYGGTINFAGVNSLNLAGGRADLYYNPSSYTAPTDYSVVMGTTPFTAWMLVNDVTQLQAINTNLVGSYALGADINASATATWNSDGLGGYYGFAPVGVYTLSPTYNYSPFTGQFDGLGHTISNLYINRPTETYVGLFGYAGGSISNIGLAGASITGLSNVGGLAGYSYGTIGNSSFSGSVKGSSSVGGLVGYNGGTIDNSSASGAVSGASNVGGLAGYSYGTIGNSYVSSGSVSGTSYVGGLVGGDNGVTNNSHYDIANVTINGSSYVTLGGLYTLQYQDWLTHGLSLNIANYSATLVSAGVNNYTINSVQGMRDLLGFADNAAYTFTLGNTIDLVNDPGLYIPYLAADFDGKNFTIANLSINLANDNLGLFGHIASGSTVSNVVLSNALVTGGSNIGALAGMNDGTINTGSSANGSVTGNSSVGGLAGHNNGTISGSNVSGASVTGSNSAVGGLAGLNYGTIDTSYASGGSVNGVSDVGGLVGSNRANSGTSNGVRTNGIISNSYVSTGSVSSTGNYVGGLVGYNDFGTISNSHVDTGTAVNGVDYVGGLVGYDGGEGFIYGNTVTGAIVTGNSYVGGLVGEVAQAPYYTGYADNNHVVNSSVSGGTVSGGSYVGGMMGWNGGTISNSYVSGGSVAGSTNVGGLVGMNATATTSLGVCSSGGCISNNYVSGGKVSASGNNVGGLVGNNAGDVSGSYVNGGTVISAVSDGSGNGGGLVGYNSGSITNSFVSNGSVSGGSSAYVWYMGGLVGQNAGSISNTYASGDTVSGSGSSFGGLVGYNTSTGSIATSYASNGVVGAGTIGGLVGNNAYGGTVSATFWNTTAATGVSFGIGNDAAAYGGTNIGATGLDSAGMITMSNFTAAGWDIANVGGAGSVWRIYEGYTAPLLTSFLTPLTVTADNATMIYDGNPFSGGNGVSYSVAGAGTSVFGTPIYGGTSQGAIDLGSYTISVAGLYSGQLGYDLTFVDATLAIIPPVAPPVVDKTLTGEIVDIADQRDKRKPEYLVTTENTPDTTTQSLPMCN